MTNTHLVAASFTFALFSCSTKQQSNSAPPSLPAGATQYPTSAAIDADNAATVAAQFASDEALVKAYVATHPSQANKLPVDPPPTVQRLSDGNYLVTTTGNDGRTFPVVTMGHRVQYGTFADAIRGFPTLDNQAKIYAALYPRMPTSCGTNLPSPSAAAALSAADLVTLNQNMATCYNAARLGFGRKPPATLAATDLPENEEGAPTAGPTGASGLNGILNGILGGLNPSDEPLTFGGDGAQARPSGSNYSIYDLADWPGKHFDSTVKNQAGRGTCAAFAMVGAFENYLAQGLGRHLNLSEQALYAVAKLHFQPDSENDGLYPGAVADSLKASGFHLPHEGFWLYNPAPYRQACPTILGFSTCAPSFFQYSCASPASVDNGELIYVGGSNCSDTTHEAPRICNSSGCNYYSEDQGNDGYQLKQSVELAANGSVSGSSVAQASAFAALGFPLVVSLSETDGFNHVGNPGFIYADDGSVLGGHALEVSGVIANDELPYGLPTGDGGGYFILKNSWGSYYGDGGYLYLSWRYVENQANSIVAMTGLSPGVNYPPTVSITTPANNAQFELAAFNAPITFSALPNDVQDGSFCCAVSWASDKDGPLGNGTTIQYPFTSPGVRTVTATATDSDGASTSTSIRVVVNIPPQNVTIVSPMYASTSPSIVGIGQSLYVGQIYQFAGNSTDADSLSNLPCSDLAWTSSDPGDQFPFSGCEKAIVFSTAGPRTITLTSTYQDPAGFPLVAAVSLNLTVETPPVDSPPQISIVSPVQGSALNPGSPNWLQAQVTSSSPLTNITWLAEDSHEGNFTIASGGAGLWQVAWTPTNNYFFSGTECGQMPLNIQVTATNAYGTSVTPPFSLVLNWPECIIP